jgi:ornithine cyclodeaminase
MKILNLEQISEVLPSIDLITEIEKGFVAYSLGQSVVPPVGELLLEDPPGDVHIKYGYLKGGDYYVIKIASGFYGNPQRGLPSSNGMMLLFRQQTGEPEAILLDEGYLTDIRTAVAGAIAAKYLAPKDVRRIGIVGTGTQAHLQLEHLKPVTDCRDVLAWGRDPEKLDQYASDMGRDGFTVATTKDANEILRSCQLVVTTTPSVTPLLTGPVLPGTHITAMGSDTHDKQELDVSLLGAADLVVADSIPQCLERGEIHQALNAGAINREEVVELGSIIAGDAAGRTSAEQITVADLTGVAVQDIQIATAVLKVCGD